MELTQDEGYDLGYHKIHLVCSGLHIFLQLFKNKMRRILRNYQLAHHSTKIDSFYQSKKLWSGLLDIESGFCTSYKAIMRLNFAFGRIKLPLQLEKQTLHRKLHWWIDCILNQTRSLQVVAFCEDFSMKLSIQKF